MIENFFTPDGTVVRLENGFVDPPEVAYHSEHRVFVGSTFLTFNDYIAYAASTERDLPETTVLRGIRQYDEKPLVNVSLRQIVQYLNWLNPRIPFAWVVQRIRTVGLYNKQLAEQMLKNLPDQADWRGHPPPYLLSGGRLFLIPNAQGFRLPTKEEYMNTIASSTPKEYDLAKPGGKVKTGEGISINGDKTHPHDDGLVYDISGLVRQFIIKHKPDYVAVTNARKLMEVYYEQFPEWEAIVRPRAEAFFNVQSTNA